MDEISNRVFAFFDDVARERGDDLDRGRATAKAQRSEQFARTVLERVDEVISILDLEARFRFVSPAVEHVLGYRVEDLLGRSGVDFVHPNDIASATALFAESIANPGRTTRADLRLRAPPGAPTQSARLERTARRRRSPPAPRHW